MNVVEAFLQNRNRTPEAPMVRQDSCDISYAEMDQRSDRVRDMLRQAGVAVGDRVALQVTNRSEFVETVLGTLKVGAILVPVSYLDGAKQLQHFLDDSHCRVLVIEAGLPGNALGGLSTTDCQLIVVGSNQEESISEDIWRFDEAVALAPITDANAEFHESQDFYIGYTSGSTGAPKGVVRTHASVTRMAFAVATEIGLRRGWTQLVAMPMCHSGALWQLVFNLVLGGAVGFLPGTGFDADVALKLIERWKVSWSVLVPTMSDTLIAAEDNVSGRETMRVILSGSAPMFSSTKQGLLERFPHAELNECYGATETGVAVNLGHNDQLRKARCVGRPLPGVEIRIEADDGGAAAPGEAGEVLVRSAYVMREYLGLPEKTKESIRSDGFVGVGDIGRLDDEGYLYIVDRKNDMIITGGLNVYPAEVEEWFKSQPDVTDAVVVGVPNDHWGEEVVAVLIGDEGLNTNDLGRACRGALPRYKVPKRIIVWPELPKLVSGKNSRRLVREQLLEAS